MFLPGTWGQIGENVGLIFSYVSEPRLTPPAWALTVELFYYAAIGLGLSRSRKLTACWFTASLIFTVAINVARVDFDVKYFSISAASLPFSTGAMIYHFRRELGKKWPLLDDRRAPLALFALCVGEVAVAYGRHAYFKLGILR